MSIDVHNRRSSDSIAKLFIKIDRSGSGPHPNTKHTAAHNPGDIVTQNESSKGRRQYRWNIHKYVQNIFINLKKSFQSDLCVPEWFLIEKRMHKSNLTVFILLPIFCCLLWPCDIQFKSEPSRNGAHAHAYQFPPLCCFKRYHKVTFENKWGLKSYILNVDIEKEFPMELRLSAFPGRLLQLVYILV